MKQVKLFFGVLLVSLLLAQGALAARTWGSNLRQGDNGTRVTALQYLLKYRGYSLTADGDFGPTTDSRVRSFQNANGLSVDGIVGANTWERLVTTVRQGDYGNHVKAIQYLLRYRYGYSISVDGDFGPATASAVYNFQSQYSELSNDGIVGANTWAVLLGGSPDNGNGGGGDISHEQFLEELVPFVSHWEGREYTMYYDSVGVPTIGVGFNLNRSDAPSKIAAVGASYNGVRYYGHALNDAQIDQLLEWDLEQFYWDARDLISNFDQHPYEIRQIFVDMTFNLGKQGFANFVNTRAAFERFDYNAAADGMQNSAWYNQVGRRSRHHVETVRSYAD